MVAKIDMVRGAAFVLRQDLSRVFDITQLLYQGHNNCSRIDGTKPNNPAEL